ncbi:hypothetical protein SteCoe_32547 [Stentor coeruleus]|uniref:Uncharacterized protein n=1 Tax=Stentor coeruleus TaxID=5963 RepID=A0A1R2AYR7_9CILI|nr:hypothetical protein SteCoe_32547 [Stentor coeruleus]
MHMLLLFMPMVSGTLLFGFKQLNFTFNNSQEVFNFESKKVYESCVPTSFQVNSQGKYFISLPRLSDEIPATLAEVVNTEIQPLLSPFPDWWSNNIQNQKSFGSITTFEIDLEDNFWLVDNKKKALIKLSPTGEWLAEYDLNNAMKNNSSLVDMALDLDRGFAYISDQGAPGIIVVNIALDESMMFLFNHFTVKPDPSFWITINNQRVYNDTTEYVKAIGGIALSCDKRDLYYSPVTSRELFAISTQYLRNFNATLASRKTVYLGYKNTASQGVVISEKGHMYLTDISESNVLFYEQMMPYPDYFLVYFLRHVMNESTTFLWPYSLSFDNNKMSLLVLANQIHNFNQKTINFVTPIYGEYNYWVYEVYVNDRSYLYRCKDVVSVHSEIDIPVWIYALISILSLIMITLTICAVKHYRMIKKRHMTLIYN